MTRVTADTGPLVAFLNARDPHHAWARETFDGFRLPLVTCEAVLSEACVLVRRAKGRPERHLGAGEPWRHRARLPAVVGVRGGAQGHDEIRQRADVA